MKSSATDGRERIVLEEKFQELEENREIAEKKLLEAKSENVRMKAEMRHGVKVEKDGGYQLLGSTRKASHA